MTTSTETRKPTKCEPSAVVDQIVPWSGVREGDLMLWDGEFRPVNRVAPYGRRDQGVWAVHFADVPGEACLPVGAYVAVRRYVTGTAARAAGYSARGIAQDLTNALTGHGSVEVDRDLSMAGEQLTRLLEQARDTLEKVAAADAAEYALGDLLPADWGKWSSAPGTALARYLHAALAIAERYLGRLPLPGDEEAPEDCDE